MEQSMDHFDAVRFSVESATGGKNTILTDDIGMPSVMVRIPKFRWCEVIEGGEDKTCSAFIVGGAEVDCIYISKYLNVIEKGRAYSLPGREPAHTLTIQEAREACMKKGLGWHLLSNAEWMAIAHWSRKNGTLPHGNNSFGKDFFHIHEHGVNAATDALPDTPIERTLTGSGPSAWTHDHSDAGITDLNGNLWDHVSGLRIVDGEIQIIPDNDSALNVDEGETSPFWKALDTGGNLVMPGSPDTYKYDGVQQGNAEEKISTVNGGVRLSTIVNNPQYNGKAANADFSYVCMNFQRMGLEQGIKAHILLQELGLFPLPGEHRNERLFIRNYGERLPSRGGSWFDNAYAGLFELYIRDSRSYKYPDLGFRAAYIER
jgi:hypothetical protein